jgi:hypothetical protein
MKRLLDILKTTAVADKVFYLTCKSAAPIVRIAFAGR